MEPVKLINLSVKRTRLRPWVDLSGFFAFFGISGVDHDREERLQKRFEEEYYRNYATVMLSARVAPGTYTLDGLPQEANRLGWTVNANGTATSRLSDDALASLRAWMERGTRTVHPTPL
ncbi:hypothetical protein DAETH_31500 [Deinococcus aetherius]|uniref:Uncharacterized protein n=1 Tax=Deinococcus aetherius TaxID=200252 RepID=A0ABN6RN32_9DEIO|nr:hypothetical protein [Deinococcus aetherius]BDP43181.1 hypothetical protein DAETH_31500 [Deinococcus aetherius]